MVARSAGKCLQLLFTIAIAVIDIIVMTFHMQFSNSNNNFYKQIVSLVQFVLLPGTWQILVHDLHLALSWSPDTFSNISVRVRKKSSEAS